MRGRSRMRVSGLGLFVVAALAAGCLGRSPAVQHYTLSPSGGGAGGADSELAIGLGPVTLPDYLARNQLVTRRAGSEVEIDERSRWAGGFESNVKETLADDLGARLGSDRVFLDPGLAPTPVAFQVSVDFRQFEGVDGEGVVLRARWIVRERDGEKRIWSRESTIRQETGGGVPGLVSAHDQALGRLADEIATLIREAR
ncbi:MAG: PqiC family protein [Myxococcota bacterium]